jgi:hypothetical protein
VFHRLAPYDIIYAGWKASVGKKVKKISAVVNQCFMIVGKNKDVF